MSSSLIPGKAKGPRDAVTAFRRHEPGTQPDYLYPAYRATRLRAPSQPLIFLPHTRSEVAGPVFGHSDVHPNESDLTLQHAARCFSMCNHFLRINQDPARGRP
jgi:Protocatechuate 3,4-dioxygenase beta subunit N terminal